MEEGAGNSAPLVLSPLQLYCNNKKITLDINFIVDVLQLSQH